jgi:hypothetical protein
MNKLILLLLIFGIVLPIKAQYVRSEKYNTEHERRLQYALNDWISYLSSKKITSAAVGNNYIYFSAYDGGILRYELYQNYWDYPYTTSNGLPSNRVLSVTYDFTTGYLWAITDVDTCIFLPAEQEWLCQTEADFWPYQFPGKQMPANGNQIAYNIFYPAGYLNLLPNFFANGPYTVIDPWKIMDENFDEFPVTGFLRDHWERIWFVIEGLGFGIGNNLSQRMDVIPYGLSQINPKVIEYQNNDLWIAGEPRQGYGRPGIVNWRDLDGGWYYYQARWISHLPSDNVIDIVVTGDSVWFATTYGLSLYNTAKDKWKNFDESKGLLSTTVLDLLIHNNKLYVATDKGINIIDLSSGIIKRFKDENISLATVYQMTAQHDTLWAATNRGILRLRSRKTGWETVITSAAISDIPTTAIEAYHDELWFASPAGIFWWDGKSNRWESFPQIGMEINGPFFDIEVNEVSVWVSTSVGILKYNRKMKYWKLFSENDGLLDNRCFRLLLNGDYLWIANNEGITQFYWNNPDRID